MILLLLGFLQPRPFGAPDQVAGTEKGKEPMSSIQDVTAEQLAKLFHHYRGALAHDFGGQGGEQEPSPWDRTPQQERKLMVAAARLALLELASEPAQIEASRPYFAKPGEADWGC
jgi:hypothetical protein